MQIKKDIFYLLCWLVRNIHPKTASSPKSKKLFVNSQVSSGLIVLYGLGNDLIPQTPDGGKLVLLHAVSSCCHTVKPQGPLDEAEAPLAHDTPIEGTPL